MINNITFENPMLGVGIFEESDGQFFKAETGKKNTISELIEIQQLIYYEKSLYDVIYTQNR